MNSSPTAVAASRALRPRMAARSQPFRILPALLRQAAALVCMGALALAATSTPGATAETAADADWPMLGLNPQRTDASDAATGITAANAPRLRRRTIMLPGTVDSSPIYLHEVIVNGVRRDAFFMTTSYGKTLALDASSGRILWVFTPPGYAGYAGSYRITTSTPAADPDRQYIYAAAPTGRVYRLLVSNGHQQTGAGWPVAITRLPSREKITGAINLSGSHVIAATGGYIGDEPPYQGHVVVIDRPSGRILSVFNTLCANLHRLLDPGRDCSQSHGSVWARDAVRVQPNGNLLFATGRGRADDRTYFGNSVLELTPNAREIVGYWTPADANDRDTQDIDVGSTGPVPTGRGTILQSGKDGKLHVIRLGKPGREVQTLDAPGGNAMIAGYPAIWAHAGRTTIFLATDSGGTAAYNVNRNGTLRRSWSNSTPGTSPIVAGELLYVYDPGGALMIYDPLNGNTIARLAAGPGHWNAPLIVNGRIALPTGDANDHKTNGTLTLYQAP